MMVAEVIFNRQMIFIGIQCVGFNFNRPDTAAKKIQFRVELFETLDESIALVVKCVALLFIRSHGRDDLAFVVRHVCCEVIVTPSPIASSIMPIQARMANDPRLLAC